MNRPIAFFAAAAAALAVILGAFGAHALSDPLAERGSTETWRTAVDYQMWHALALLLLASGGAARCRLAIAAAGLFAAGIVLFSGSLYWLALGGPRWLGPVTPLGGLALIGGWIFTAVAAVRIPHGSS